MCWTSLFHHIHTTLTPFYMGSWTNFRKPIALIKLLESTIHCKKTQLSQILIKRIPCYRSNAVSRPQQQTNSPTLPSIDINLSKQVKCNRVKTKHKINKQNHGFKNPYHFWDSMDFCRVDSMVQKRTDIVFDGGDSSGLWNAFSNFQRMKIN